MTPETLIPEEREKPSDAPMTLEALRDLVVGVMEQRVAELLEYRDILTNLDLSQLSPEEAAKLRQQLTDLGITHTSIGRVHQNIGEISPPKELKPSYRYAWAEGAD